MDDNLSFVLDKAGFPLLWVEDIEAYIHWLPITKVQFETCICAQPDPKYDETFYDTVNQLNERITPSAISLKNYWQAFMSGLTPREAQHYAAWCGDDYSLPTKEDWFRAYQALSRISAVQLDFIEQMEKIPERGRTLLRKIEAVTKSLARNQNIANRTLAHQMLMKYGLLEWIEAPALKQGYGGMGEPVKDFHNLVISVDKGNVHSPINPFDARMSFYGFRLIRRPE